MENRKVRKSGIELLRIISMLMIVSSHYIGVGGVYEHLSINRGITDNIMIFIDIISKISVYCYVLISGYYLFDSKFKIEKIFRITLEVTFYSILFYFIFIITGKEKLTLIGSLKSFFPILFKEYWFVSCYVALYLLSPLLNIMLKVLDRQKYIILIILLGIYIYVWDIIVMNTSFTIRSQFLEFIFIYICAGYLKRWYKKDINNNLYLFYAILINIFMYSVVFILNKLGYNLPYSGLYNTIRVFTIIQSILIFLYFINLKFISLKINKIASLSLAVYLIHNNRYVKTILFSKLLQCDLVYYSKSLLFHWIISVLLIFVVSILIDYFRQKLLNDKLKIDDLIINKIEVISKMFIKKNRL